MSSAIVEQFVTTLQDAERTRDPELLSTLFADDATLAGPIGTPARKGPAGVRQFWLDHVKRFAEIRTEFTHIVETEDAVLLRWVSRGSYADGTLMERHGSISLRIRNGTISRLELSEDLAGNEASDLASAVSRKRARKLLAPSRRKNARNERAATAS